MRAALPLALAALASPVAAYPPTKVALPAKINAAYPGTGTCNATQIVHAVATGLNTVIWSFIALGADETGAPTIDTSQFPDPSCVARVITQLEAMNLTTVHTVSIGGWGTPHPKVTDPASVPAVYANWKAWNEGLASDYGFSFSGVDWDLEGVNDLTSPDNLFTVDCLNMVGRFSQMAKEDGYIVSLVPPESYLDVTNNKFSLSLTNAFPDWHPTFHYHSYNAYAFLLAKYGLGPSNDPTFDFITIQLYESYSRSNQNITAFKQPAAEFLQAYIPRVYAGWEVDFASVPAVGIPSQQVAVGPKQLVIGLANGWTGGEPALLIWPADVGKAYKALDASGQAPRGFAFWDIQDEGAVPPGASKPLWMAAGINAFLHTRP